MNPQKKTSADTFSQISLAIASPEQIRSWSHGEVHKPETINYRTQKPEMDGLFCERIFGPTKNYECYCGKYKRIRYKGIICEKCGVEVTHSSVRRERMGHVDLAVPVAHIWYLRSTPSRIGLMLDLPIKQLEQVIYFASYIVTAIDEEAKTEALETLDKDVKDLKSKAKSDHTDAANALQLKIKAGQAKPEELNTLLADYDLELESLNEKHASAKKELTELRKGQVLTELEYRNLNLKYGHVFTAGTGAESVQKLMEEIDFATETEKLQKELSESTGQKQKKILKRLSFLRGLQQANIRPEWMLMSVLPIIPPDLRPMVQLDGGRFAASDLNDLYRRIINRNNRLKRLALIGAPEVIQRNEKRMLQEAIDTLIHNSPRTGRAVYTAGDRRKLRSLSDMLKGKQGRFRQNLLGKRVDYSGRSVIVVGPTLKLHQCGLPKEMAMKLFKPFVIGELIREEYVHNVKSAEKYISSGKRIVWDILERVTKNRYVLLNRAPTLHRLGIQAFEPILIEGKAIQVHPLVCAAFNADFDGDQMAVHLPLSEEAQAEARNIISSAQNLLKPSSGSPIVTPSQEIILGCYFLTQIHEGKQGEGMVFSSVEEAIRAESLGHVDLQARVRIRFSTESGSELRETSVGRAIFNSILPTQTIGYKNEVFRKKSLESLIAQVYDACGEDVTAQVADEMKTLGFRYATISGISYGKDDMIIPEEKQEILSKADEQVRQISNQYWKGFITDFERKLNAIRIWSQAKSDITSALVKQYQNLPENDIFYMVDSAARGNWGQITQQCGMKGLVANPGGETIELPIRSSLKEGFSILEYFIATHGGRKGKSDTALKTAEAGYLTRRLVDAVQDVVIREEDCGQIQSHMITKEESEKIGEAFEHRILGRTLAADLIDVSTGEILAQRNTPIDNTIIREIMNRSISEVSVRSIMDCKTVGGICSRCYGYDLGDNQLVEVGTPVGIIAAQSIGEPGTQLTMRTFHMGGVATEGADITQGLTRVEELFEARPPKTPAILSEIGGVVSIEQKGNETKIHVLAQELGTDTYQVESTAKLLVKEDAIVKPQQILAKGSIITRAQNGGRVSLGEHGVIMVQHLDPVERHYQIPSSATVKVEHGQEIKAGAPLTLGHHDLRELIELTDIESSQRYLMNEVQGMYASQGQTINDKHIEIIVKQMFSRIRVIDPGDAEGVISGDRMDVQATENINLALLASGKRPIVYERLLLGLTRISLETDSWLSAASFQETIRVLVEAATSGTVDDLKGLKENVIIGKLIPAGHIYRKKYYRDQSEDTPTIDDLRPSESNAEAG